MAGCLAHGLDPGEGSSIVSILPIRAALFPFFDTREACSLRGVCRELKQAVAEFPWEDMSTVIKGSVGEEISVAASLLWWMETLCTLWGSGS